MNPTMEFIGSCLQGVVKVAVSRTYSSLHNVGALIIKTGFEGFGGSLL